MEELELEVPIKFVVHIVAEGSDAERVITEAKHRGQPIGGKYSVRYDRAHTTPGEDHIHVFVRNNQIFAMNVSGTAHDRSHGIRIPNKVVDALRNLYPDINLPPDNIVESMEITEEIRVVLESDNNRS